MTQSPSEIEWRKEFDRLGELLVFDNVKQGAIYNDEAKRQAAFRWLAEQAAERRMREVQTLKFARWTLFAAIAAVVVGIVGIAATVLLAQLP